MKNWCCPLVNTATLCVPFLSWPLYPFRGCAGACLSSVWARQGTPLNKSPAQCRGAPCHVRIQLSVPCSRLVFWRCPGNILHVLSAPGTLCFSAPYRLSYHRPNIMLLFWTHHWSGAWEACNSPQWQQLPGRQSCECSRAVPSSYRLLFFLEVIFCVWCQPSPPDCYYPSPLTTSVNLLPPSIPLHPEQTQATKHAGRQKQQQQTVKTPRSKEDDPICQPSRVFSTKSVCSKKAQRTRRCE